MIFSLFLSVWVLNISWNNVEALLDFCWQCLLNYSSSVDFSVSELWGELLVISELLGIFREFPLNMKRALTSLLYVKQCTMSFKRKIYCSVCKLCDIHD